MKSCFCKRSSLSVYRKQFFKKLFFQFQFSGVWKKSKTYRSGINQKIYSKKNAFIMKAFFIFFMILLSALHFPEYQGNKDQPDGQIHLLS
ncbi:hypothetical protein [Chryseobacterium vrystaatense]|uniref:hypothetical protein n=1 Tax=Chryseobacterium vrystaatense TaxID=307480 RepID=UPI000E40426C